VVILFFGLWAGFNCFSPNPSFLNRMNLSFVYFLIVGWFSVTILSYLSKVVPFLWWAYRFHTKWSRKNVVQLADMTANRRMQIELMLYSAGVIAVALAFLLKAPSLARFGQSAAAIMSILYIAELVKVLRY